MRILRKRMYLNDFVMFVNIHPMAILMLIATDQCRTGDLCFYNRVRYQ